MFGETVYIMKLILLLAVVPIVLTAHPKPCCSSTKFTATLLQLGGYVDPNTQGPKPINVSYVYMYLYIKMLEPIHYKNEIWMEIDFILNLALCKFSFQIKENVIVYINIQFHRLSTVIVIERWPLHSRVTGNI
jgi:hypothetical protein